MASLAAGLLAVSAAAAQETVTIGGDGRPSVEVNLDVLDGLGTLTPGVASRSGLLMPGEPRPERAARMRPTEPGARASAPGTALTLEGERPKLRRVPTPHSRRAAATSPAVAAPEPVAPAVANDLATLEPPPIAAEGEAPEPAAWAAVADAPEPVVEPPVPEETAALAPLAVPEAGGLAVIEFEGSSTRLSTAAEDTLRRVAETLAQSEGRLQLKAFAGGGGEATSGARRASLSRALAVRAYLIEQGVRSTRIDVRALGSAGDRGPPERVDVLYIAP